MSNTKLEKINLEDLQIISANSNTAGQQYKYYVYGYFVNDELKYIGRGSDANAEGKRAYARARDLPGHSHCLEEVESVGSNDINIKIIAHELSEETVRMVEAAYIKAFNTVERGWNNREELRDNKFYKILETISGEETPDVKTLVHILMKNATGASQTEPESLAKDILSKLDLEDRDVCVISNVQFGGYNILKELVEQDYPYASLGTICSEEMMMKIGADDLMDKEFLNINTGIENFLTMDFGRKKFDMIIMNPPWTGLGIKFIEKARSLLKKGGVLTCIISYNQFTDKKSRPGSFNYLQKFGAFERIECFKGMYKNDYFHQHTGKGVGDWCWFTWHNEKIRLSTKIVNRLGENFNYILDGNEITVPQLPNEKDYFDWVNGLPVKITRIRDGVKNDCTYIIPRKEYTKTGFLMKGEFPPNQCGVVTNITPETITTLSEKINLWALYGDSKTGDWFRSPPLRRDLNIILKENNDTTES